MNKTVNINLGGIFFHIDEDAFQKLSRYFDAIKRSLTNASGQDEIIKDIEMRVSELLSEKQKSDKHVIGLSDVDAVIAVMGQPEDYRIDEGGEASKSSNFNDNYTENRVRKLYRDEDNSAIGGVLAGLGHYFGVERVWLRIAFCVLFFVFGTGFLLYLILWIAIPKAQTTAEKLEMTGEPVNISNIEKKVREEFEMVSEKIKNVDYDKFGNQIRTGAEKVGNGFGDFILSVLKIFSKVIGVILIMQGFTILLFLLIGIFALGTGAFIDFPWTSFVESGNYTDYPAWTFGLLMFFAVGIPFFFLIILGFKLLSPTIKSIGRSAIYTLLAIWISAVALAISIGIKQAAAFSEHGRVVKKENLNFVQSDTLLIKFVHNDFYTKNIDDTFEFRITEDSLKNKVIYSNDVTFRIETTDEKIPYIKIEKEARGKTISEANDRARQIQYKYKLTGNNLVLDNYLLTDYKNKFRDQEVEITLYLPKGTVFKCDESVEDYDRSDDEKFNLHHSGSYNYKVLDSNIKCLDCPNDENEYLDTEEEEDELIIAKDGKQIIHNGDTIFRAEKDTESSLQINKDGIIIKTK